MRKIFLFLVMFVTVLPVYSQSLLNQTYFTPMNFSSRKENVNLRLNNGSTFIGTKHISLCNGQVNNVSYTGTLTKPSGEKYVTLSAGYGFDSNFNFTNGNLWYVTPSGEVYAQQYQNSRCVNQYKEVRPHTFADNVIVFQTVASDYSGGYSGGSGSYNNNNSGSNYNRHEAQCRGCNGSGRCQHCGGSGWVNNYKSKCSLCHGRGTCVSCAGRGKIHGNF